MLLFNKQRTIDIIDFAQDPYFLKQRLYPHQKKILRDFWQGNYTTGIWVIGRRSGKTLLVSIIALYVGTILAPLYKKFLRPGESLYIFIVANSAEQSKIALKMVKDLLNNSPLLSSWIVNETSNSLVLSNNTVFRAIPCSARSNRGYPCGLIIFDEAGHYIDTKGNSAGEALFAALTPSVAQFGNLGKIMMISSPWAKRGLFWEEYEKAVRLRDPHTQVLQLPTWEMNAGIPQSFFDRKRASNAELFDVEYGAQFHETLGYFLPGWFVDHAVNSDRQILPPSPKHRNKYYLALDPAKGGRDEYVACIAHYEGKHFVVDQWHDFKANLKLESTRKTQVNIQEVEQWILDRHRDYGFKKIVLDQYNSQGTIQRLSTRVPIEELTWTSSTKKQAFSLLKENFVGNTIEIYPEMKAIAQLKGLTSKFSASGDWSVSGGGGVAVDDYALSLAAVQLIAKTQPRDMRSLAEL